VGDELAYIQQAVTAHKLAGDGSFTERVSALLERALGAPRVLLTTSCTHALELSALLLDVQAGDEVVLPSFTFVSTANAFVLRGARPVFADIRPDTLNLDERQLERHLGPRTRVLVPVHYAGVACELDAIGALARARGLAVVEDNAHGLFGTYKGRPLGSFGALATQSFHETKNFSCGEGGALVINDPALIERAEIIREKGTNRRRFLRGEIDKYSWVDVGSSYLPSEILAAVLLAQLEKRQQIQARRQAIWDRYQERLGPVAERFGLTVPTVPAGCEQTHHLYWLLARTPAQRNALLAHLKSHGIAATFHYVPLHLSEMGKKLGAKPGDCPVAESVADRLLRLPLHLELSEPDQDRVVAALVSGLSAG